MKEATSSEQQSSLEQQWTPAPNRQQQWTSAPNQPEQQTPPPNHQQTSVTFDDLSGGTGTVQPSGNLRQ
ncbi:unnamed protein product [Phytophthora fragariaefolia]|uniref:Unnamed protein product n=1 Tax=Phytophthora fragariaefolia TaxID=1490495 RepID=A0A9W6YF68_9STRA|nr:unnamed protein product [Phytophthora fragariaefolia]